MTEPGKIIDPNEIRILILYALQALERPVPFNDLGNVVLSSDSVDYFSYSENLYELLVTGHVDRKNAGEAELYKLTRFGAQALEELWPRLPSSVREKTQKAAVGVLARQRREAEITCSVEPAGTCWHLTLSVLEKDDPLMALRLLVPNKLQAELICQRFRENPSEVYSQVVFSALGEQPPNSPMADFSPEEKRDNPGR